VISRQATIEGYFSITLKMLACAILGVLYPMSILPLNVEIIRPINSGYFGTVYLGRIAAEASCTEQDLPAALCGEIIVKIPRHNTNFTRAVLQHEEAISAILAEQDDTGLFARYYFDSELGALLTTYDKHLVALEACLKSKCIRKKNIKGIFAQLDAAFNVLMTCHLVHSDLHLNNILYNQKTGKILVIDYGLACYLGKCHTVCEQFQACGCRWGGKYKSSNQAQDQTAAYQDDKHAIECIKKEIINTIS